MLLFITVLRLDIYEIFEEPPREGNTRFLEEHLHKKYISYSDIYLQIYNINLAYMYTTRYPRAASQNFENHIVLRHFDVCPAVQCCSGSASVS